MRTGVRLAGDAQLPPDTPGSIAGSVGDYAPLTIGRADAGHTNWASGFVNMAYFIWHLHGVTAVIALPYWWDRESSYLGRTQIHGAFR